MPCTQVKKTSSRMFLAIVEDQTSSVADVNDERPYLT